MTSLFDSPNFIATCIVGLVIAFFYLRFMAAALDKAARTRHTPEEDREDNFRGSLAAAVLVVFATIGVIVAFGIAPGLLYLGPVLALVSAAAVAGCLYQELKD